MFVKDFMTASPITVPVETPIMEALSIMRKQKVHQLPVLKKGKLVGLVAERELLKASPSPATTLSVYEMNYLLSKMTIKDVLVKDPITVVPDCTIEEAALQMREHRIRSLLVVEKGDLKGIITQSDVFEALIRIFGLRKPGIRMVLEMENRVGALADLLILVKNRGFNVHAVAVRDRDDQMVHVMLRLGTANAGEELLSDFAANGIRVIYNNS